MQLVQQIPRPKQQVLPLGLKLLQYIGLWGDSRVRYKYVLMVSYIVAVWVGPKIVLGSGKDGFNSFVRNIAEIVFSSENCITIVMFAVKNRTFGKLVDVLERILDHQWPEHLQDEIESFNRRMEKFSLIYAIYISVLNIIYQAVPFLTSVVKMVLLDETERGDFTLMYEMQFYWLDIRRNSTHFFIFTAFCAPATIITAYIIIVKGVILQVIIHYGSKIFDLVSKRIDAMAKLTNVDERHKEFLEIIRLHHLALEYMTYLENTASLILMNLMMSCLLVWCLMLFYVSSNFGPDAVNVIVLFVALVIEMAVYCINGSYLSEKAVEVAHAMYRYPWYKESIEMQKSVQFIIKRSQKPTGITAAKFYFVNIQRFGATLQATYSYFIILKDRF
ncbi:odorant receptor 13a-like [Malaya genurostris]|uniref:odorant receptor 13a-like n=1 Tax=Malaya genurostris TaxID=325434 RepID=UPI0026F3AD52|nr:odorant receptor 13a-like [Malaya genurostris]